MYNTGDVRGRGVGDRLKDNDLKACRKKIPFLIYEGPQTAV